MYLDFTRAVVESVIYSVLQVVMAGLIFASVIRRLRDKEQLSGLSTAICCVGIVYCAVSAFNKDMGDFFRYISGMLFCTNSALCAIKAVKEKKLEKITVCMEVVTAIILVVVLMITKTMKWGLRASLVPVIWSILFVVIMSAIELARIYGKDYVNKQVIQVTILVIMFSTYIYKYLETAFWTLFV